MLNQTDINKKIAGEEAVKYIKSGMIIGLGSGSTISWMLKKLAIHVDEGLSIRGVATSLKTERIATEFGIPLIELSDADQIDLAIDGADEVDKDFNLLKGGGGSLVREKIVDVVAEELVIIIDDSKKVSSLGTFPLPVEVTPFGWKTTASKISQLGVNVKLRERNNSVFISDNGNYILDCEFTEISNPKELNAKLKLLTGVVETGLFIEMANKVIVGTDKGVEVLS